ncbi:hypothetical protein ABTL33_19650, partial [Acinetobacter baumannii]
SVTSGCGYYSGPLTFTVTSLGGNALHFDYGFGGYDGTFNGNSATGAGGAVVFTLRGNTFEGYEADSCQDGFYTKQ